MLPLWVDANFGFAYTTFDKDGNPGPKTDSKTRTIYFRVRNAHGGESELRLISLQHDHEVKPRLKSSRFSAIWFSELSNFRDVKVFQTSWQQLRMFHLKPWQHLWIGDTNPSDEGEDSWIYQLWYKRRLDILKGDEKASEFGLSLRKITFALEDNMILTTAEKYVLKQLYADDPGELAREFEGKWVRGHGNKGKHFADVFMHSIHVIGDSIDDAIELSDVTDALYTGWDLGAAVNHAAVIMEKRLITSEDGEKEWPVFCVIDEMFHKSEQLSISDLGLEMLDKMTAIETEYGRKFHWTHYSDDSATSLYRASSGSFDYLEILNATDNAIHLIGVQKPTGSVQARVRLLRRLLRERRFYISSKCTATIDMLMNCKQGSTHRDFVEWNEWKHMFDAITYVLFMECAADLEIVLSVQQHARRWT